MKLDFGALVDGYHSDMTRTVVLGPAAAGSGSCTRWSPRRRRRAGPRSRRASRWPTSTPRPARSSPTPGAASSSCTRLGHGVGLQIHEAPLLAATVIGTLAAGMAVTVEPGVYLDGRGGVRIEDTLVVRDGEPELLTRFPKELLEI